MRRLVIPAFVLAGAIAAAASAWPADDPPVEVAASRLPPLPPAPTWQPPPIDSFAEMVERPLFTPSRRPPARKVEAAMPLKTPEGRLVGVVVGNGAKVALIEETGGTKAIRRLKEGQSFDGWMVADIAPGRVLL
ncbi:MAG TPA: hypothetical protein VLL76_01195, partial [Candidatus Omnitrophota bacterium]|nr:hypothetical protein [Candidatus Omnitrophota bacterium]